VCGVLFGCNGTSGPRASIDASAMDQERHNDNAADYV